MDLDSKLHHMTTPILTETPQGVVSQGSGFFYRVDGQPPDPNTPGWQWVPIEMWVITNRHVVMPKIEGVEVRPSTITVHLRRWDASGQLSWAPVTLSGGDIKERVKLHPNERVDVAAINVSELLIQEIESHKPQFSYAAPFLLSRGLLTRNNKEIQVEASSDVLVVGYPEGFYDDVNLFPVVKSGIVASRWGARFQGDPCFLVDAKLFPGSSGSVVISKPGVLGLRDGQLLMTKDGEKAFALLGIFSATYELDLGVVWYAEAIEELVGG